MARTITDNGKTYQVYDEKHLEQAKAAKFQSLKREGRYLAGGPSSIAWEPARRKGLRGSLFWGIF